ncbi:MAG: hypothetical protein E7660_02150 [Ruminococcaceae bacterium]|nr:hypothetical protein [Oscillospiraceae bacterium]
MTKALRFLCLIIAALTLFSLASCKKKTGVPALTLENSVVTENMYNYWLCSYKANFLASYEDVKDTEEFWQSELYDGSTAEEFLEELVLESVEMDLVAMHLFDKFGLSITNEDRKAAENIVADLCEYTGGGKNDFNRAVSVYGVNYDMLVNIYLEEFKSTYVYDYVFENNVLVVDDEVKQAYLEDNYARVRHIYINDAYDSEKSYYDSDGNFVMEPYDDAKQAEKDAKVAAAKTALDTGADFDTVYKEYSEETAYEKGYYLNVSTTGLPSELITNAYKIDVGETMTFETQYGTHIIKRLEMDKAPYNDKANEDFFEDFTDSVYENTYMEYVRSYFDEITVDEEILAKYPVKDALPNYSFQY